MISVKYQGRRFPRSVSLRGGGTTSFQPNRLVLTLDEYDALFLLKANNRLTPERWEFTVEGVEKQENVPLPEKPQPSKEDIIAGGNMEASEDKPDTRKEKPVKKGRPKKEMKR